MDRDQKRAVDDSGNVYTTGEFTGTKDFDPGPGVFNLTTANSDVFVLKLDSSGNFVWAGSMGGTGPDFGHAINVDTKGYVYVAGGYIVTGDFDPRPTTFNLTPVGADAFVVKVKVP